MIEIISATRLSESDFWNKSALGISLRRLGRNNQLLAHIAITNRRGLPEIYNARILAQNSSEILVFVHDDVWIDDYFLVDRLIAGLQSFDVIGVAGNRRQVPDQPSWAFLDTKFVWDDRANLSGSIAHGQTPFGTVNFYGAAPAACELLDGVFLAARKTALTKQQVLFDPRFQFHFYDLDFCRSARQQGLSLGTWPICLTHQSGGNFDSPQWQENYQVYREKWAQKKQE